MSNNLLYRSIKSGNEFLNLIPKAKQKADFIGDGDTHFSIMEMRKVVLENYHQVYKLAKKLEAK